MDKNYSFRQFLRSNKWSEQMCVIVVFLLALYIKLRQSTYFQLKLHFVETEMVQHKITKRQSFLSSSRVFENNNRKKPVSGNVKWR